MVRVLVVSPLPAVRAGLRALLQAADDVRVVGEAAALATRVEQAPEAAADAVGAADVVDVVLVDLQPGLDVSDQLELSAPDQDDPGADPGPGLVLLGSAVADARLAAGLAGRAWGYLPRDAAGEQIVSAVRAVGAGLIALEPAMGAALLSRGGGARPTPSTEDGDELTTREREVLQLVAEGLANKHIARRLGISEHTVKFHVAAVLTKLGAGSRTEAAHLGARRGLVAL
jgi:DNA-binding NarL/FixJ family response regulator